MAKATERQFVCVTTNGKFRRLDIGTVGYPRFEKDILRVGRWEVSTVDDAGKPCKESWDVTPKLLSMLVENFNRFAANGNRCPWIIDHDGGAEERYGDVVALRVDDETLWATHELQEKKYQASFGEQPGDETPQEVSVDVRDNFKDGAGNFYPVCLIHVANVVNPVVTNQRGFRRLSLVSKGRQMAKAAADTGSENADTFSIDEVKKMLADAGYAVPDIATTKESVMASFMALTGSEGGEDPAADDTSGIPPLPTDGNMASLDAASPRTLKMWVKQSARQLSIVNKEKAAIEAARAADAKAAFESDVETLLAENKITPADKPELIESGKSSGWKLSMLAPFKRLQGNATPQDPLSRRLSANGGNGVVDEHKPKSMTADRSKEVAKNFRNARL